MGFRLKLNDNSQPVLQDGKPVYINEETNEEEAFDFNQAWNKIHSLNEENKKRRLEAEEAAKKLQQFESIDLEKVKANEEAAKKLEEVEMVKNGEIDKLKSELVEASEKREAEIKSKYESMVQELKEHNEKLNKQIEHSIMSEAFANSSFLSENLAMTPKMALKYFGDRFRVDPETKKVYAVGEDGSELRSEKKLGEVAPFDEALALLVKNDPDKDTFLKSKQQPGGGMGKGGRGYNGSDEAYLNDPNVSPQEKMNFIRKRQAASGRS